MNDRKNATVVSVIIFCFASLGFVWSMEAFVKVLMRVLGL